VIQFIQYSDKWTKIGVNVGICWDNNQGNFQLYRFTTSENISTKTLYHYFISRLKLESTIKRDRKAVYHLTEPVSSWWDWLIPLIPHWTYPSVGNHWRCSCPGAECKWRSRWCLEACHARHSRARLR